MKLKATFRRTLSLLCVLALLLTGMIDIVPPVEANLSERTAPQEKSNDPFSLMYDSNEKLAEEIERMPELIRDEALLEDEPVGDSKRAQGKSSGKSISEAPLVEDVADAVRAGDFESIEELDLPEESAERIQRMIDESGEDRYIVEYRSKSSADILEHDIRVEGAAYELAELTQVIVLEEKMNPAELAEILREAGAEEDILYIQPDFALSIDSLSLAVEEVDNSGPTEDPKDEEQEADTSDSVEETEDQDEVDIDETEETGTDEPGEDEDSEPPDEGETVEDIEDIELPEEVKFLETVLEPRPVLIAVIDTGVDATHPMLEGYISDGWNFVDGSDDIYDDNNPLASAHGTHVAGIIVQGAEEYGADVTILPLKVFENGVAYTSHIIEAIQYAEEQGAQIINCSFGSTNENPALLEAIEASNALFICAAGNSRRDLDETPSYPACYRLDNVISVSSVNADGGFSYFSNYSTNLVDITALGRDVVSALPEGETGPMTGTSMATAEVSSAAAVVLSLYGAAEIEQEPLGDEKYIEPPTDEDVFTEPEIADEDNELLPEEESGFVTESVGVGVSASTLHITRLSDKTAVRVESENVEAELTATELRLRLLGGADRLENLYNKVEDGRRLNTDSSIIGESGDILDLNPENDFDVHGYQPTQSELFELYSAAGEIVQVAAGGDHSVVLKENGTVWAWGNNLAGQLGDGTVTSSSNPVQVSGLNDVIAIAGGWQHSLALKSDGSVWAWGDNTYGQLGDGTTTRRPTPVQVSGLNDVIAIAGGYIHSLALKSDGTVWAWGYNNYGQLGDGTTTSKTTPVQVSGLNDAIAIAGGHYHSLVLKSDGTVWAWGDNDYGQLGDRTVTNRTTPVQVSGLDDVIAIAGGHYHSLVLKSDGTAWAWGYNQYGQLGDGTREFRTTPVQVSGLNDVIAIAGGYYHSLALRSDGTVWAWGYNQYGQLGDGTETNRTTPVQVNGLNDVITIACGNYHSLALKSDGTVWAWGYNFYGQLGDGTTTVETTPVQVSGLNDVITIAGGFEHSLALKSDGAVLAWGYNPWGQLGDGSTTSKTNPVQVSDLNDVIAIAGGYHHSLALKSDGTVWACGYNQYGQLGDGTGIWKTTPVQVSGLNDVIAIACGHYHSLALKSDGTVWAWGDNTYGQLGDETITNRTTPVQVNGLNDVIAIACGNYHSLALKSDGTVWAWGNNSWGQLGDGTRTSRTTPVQVSSLNDVVAIAGGWEHSLALKSDGTVWAWGDNNYGQFGDGSTTSKTIPVQVRGLNDVIAIASGSSYSLALKSDGTVWAWGNNTSGQLGDGTTTRRLTPVQASGLNDVIAISGGSYHSLALKSDGTVWAWGYNNYGQLGDGRILQTSTPIRATTNDLSILEFVLPRYELAIPDIAIATLTVTAVPYDAYDQPIADANITYSLSSPYPGVTINAATGEVTITSATLPGEVELVATCEDLVATATLVLQGKEISELTFSPVMGTQYVISILATEIETFDGRSFTLIYDPTVLVPVDLCAFTWMKELAEGDIAGTGITIVSFSEGEIIFSVDKDIPPDKAWSGVLNAVRFRALSNGSTTLSVSLLS